MMGYYLAAIGSLTATSWVAHLLHKSQEEGLRLMAQSYRILASVQAERKRAHAECAALMACVERSPSSA